MPPRRWEGTTKLVWTVVGNVMQHRIMHLIEGPSGRTVKFAPGGLPVMFNHLTMPLKNGATFPLNLKFESAGSVTADVVGYSRLMGEDEAGTLARGAAANRSSFDIATPHTYSCFACLYTGSRPHRSVPASKMEASSRFQTRAYSSSHQHEAR